MIQLFPWKSFLRRKSVWLSLLIIFSFGMVAALAPWLAPHDPYASGFTQADLPPMWVQDDAYQGQADYPLGTDRLGRDVLSRLLYGTRTAFLLALLAVPTAALFGTLAGLVAGYAGGRIDAGIQLVMDVIQSLPGIMFMVVVILIFRSLFPPSWFQGVITLAVGFSVVSWASLARLIRINVLTIKSSLFVEAAVGLGASPKRIILRHLLPNVMHVVLVWIINNFPIIILLEAFLGYIGVGVTSFMDGGEFTVVSWGGMFFSGRSALSRNPMMLIVPSLCVLLVSMSFILLADFMNNLTRHGKE